MRYVIGIDAGGTKTVGLLADEKAQRCGEILLELGDEKPRRASTRQKTQNTRSPRRKQ